MCRGYSRKPRPRPQDALILTSAMPRCPYCRRTLPGVETLCQTCFDAGYGRVTAPNPWWLSLRPTLTWTSLCTFLFYLLPTFLIFRIDAAHPPTRRGFATVMILGALASTLITKSVPMDQRRPTMIRHRLWGFPYLICCVFVRLWLSHGFSTVKNPALFAVALAAIPALLESMRREPQTTQQPQLPS